MGEGSVALAAVAGGTVDGSMAVFGKLRRVHVNFPPSGTLLLERGFISVAIQAERFLRLIGGPRQSNP